MATGVAGLGAGVVARPAGELAVDWAAKGVAALQLADLERVGQATPPFS
jgi:hypothetical protein